MTYRDDHDAALARAAALEAELEAERARGRASEADRLAAEERVTELERKLAAASRPASPEPRVGRSRKLREGEPLSENSRFAPVVMVLFVLIVLVVSSIVMTRR